MTYVLSIKELQQFFYERVNKIKKEKNILEGIPYEQKKVIVRCHTCGKEFSRYKSRVVSNNFCSKMCWDKMRGEITGKFLKRRKMRANSPKKIKMKSEL